MHWQGYTYNRGEYYAGIGWTLTLIGLTTVALRLYSRTWLTRSVGSDDFAVLIAFLLSFEGQINATIAVAHGLGRHSSLLAKPQISQVEKWLYVNWLMIFLKFFFIRASVMLFVLRLLPSTKKLQQRIVYIAFFLNFAITMIATITYGLKCRPFTAIYKSVPNAKCLPEETVAAAMYVNAALACVIDISTALIPLFLLWNVQMKRQTKISLNIIFGLGLITAGLSIGRAATTNQGAMKVDSTWREIPSGMFGMAEEKLGIIVASCPAIRQLWAYRRRVGTIYPTEKRQPPNEDFSKVRRYLNLRDIFWYRDPFVAKGIAKEARPIFQATSDTSLDGPTSPENPANKSVLDLWGEKIKQVFSFGARSHEQTPMADQSTSSSRRPLRSLGLRPFLASSKEDGLQSAERGRGWPGQDPAVAQRSIARRYNGWQVPCGHEEDSDGSASLIERSMRPNQDLEFANTLANPIQAKKNASSRSSVTGQPSR